MEVVPDGLGQGEFLLDTVSNAKEDGFTTCLDQGQSGTRLRPHGLDALRRSWSGAGVGLILPWLEIGLVKFEQAGVDLTEGLCIETIAA